jgi:hypothetical protein
MYNISVVAPLIFMSTYHKQCLKLVFSVEKTELVDKLRGDTPPREFIYELIEKASKVKGKGKK